jgi:DNA-binding NarL/FixJ family response regulator
MILTSKELEIIRLMADGNSNKVIAMRTGFSAATIETYRIRMIHKMELKNSCELVAYALRNNLIK